MYKIIIYDFNLQMDLNPRISRVYNLSIKHLELELDMRDACRGWCSSHCVYYLIKACHSLEKLVIKVISLFHT